MGKFIGERSKKQHKPRAGMSVWQKKKKKQHKKAKETIGNIQHSHVNRPLHQHTTELHSFVIMPKKKSKRCPKRRQKISFRLLTLFRKKKKLLDRERKEKDSVVLHLSFFSIAFLHTHLFLLVHRIFEGSKFLEFHQENVSKSKTRRRRKMSPKIIVLVSLRYSC